MAPCYGSILLKSKSNVFFIPRRQLEVGDEQIRGDQARCSSTYGRSGIRKRLQTPLTDLSKESALAFAGAWCFPLLLSPPRAQFSASSAAGITSGLAALGAWVGGGMLGLAQFWSSRHCAVPYRGVKALVDLVPQEGLKAPTLLITTHQVANDRFVNHT